MKARLIHNKVICGTQYLGFVLETERRVGFSYHPKHGAYNLSGPVKESGFGSTATLSPGQRLLLEKIRETVGVPDEDPLNKDLFLPHNNFTGQFVELPAELLE